MSHRTKEDIMPTLVPAPTRIEAAGNKPKIIEEFIGSSLRCCPRSAAVKPSVARRIAGARIAG